MIEQQVHALLVEVRTLIAEARREQRLAETEHRPVPEVERRIQYGIGAERRPVMVHTGDCSMGMARSRPASREQAAQALTQGVEAWAIAGPTSGRGCWKPEPAERPRSGCPTASGAEAGG
ncbi:DUF6233 domain-containing protein [Streptomyces virginiae]|uniref:DUF6233 domain-containing protein n=1 Tax=Streptomyces virginiae TaxID=1961 RepID=UPI002255A9F6|nr:DUF6233 domain-containing protein [Streptomyces virginiae]MCX4721924.1 DUF6233 domain-containing protein [Streptomyces virginiae]